MSDSVRPHRRQPTRLPCPWDSPGKNTGVGYHFLLQCMKWKVKVKSLSRVQLFTTPWTAAYQAPPSMGFSRQEYWCGVPSPSPNVPLVSLIFLKRSLVFSILMFSSISWHRSLRKAFLSLLAVLWNSAFKWVYLSFFPLPLLVFFSWLFVRPPQTAILLFCISFSWEWSWSLPPVQCHEPPSIVHQALCLSDLVP